ncbi:MAG: 30S ribosomal protein S16 [Armatimonadetes bacterium]|nr:30S ribosomal protein S16 [Armatimonadota bacterium]MDE2205331.1 30S ribosomal protein S16 [Armatimonadota bacterium]
MPIKIRLKRVGAKKQPQYRVVVANSTASRDGKFKEILGHYDPCKEGSLVLNNERAVQWLHNGAQPTDTARNLLKQSGAIELFEQEKADRKAARAAR